MSEPIQSERPLCCALAIATQDGPISEGKELSCGCGNRYKFTGGQWRNESDSAITYSTKPGCPTCQSPQPHLYPAVQSEGEVSICKDPFHSQVTPQNLKVDSVSIGLIWGENTKRELGRTHIEWHAPCGCAFHPEPYPHLHPCSDAHKRPDLHTLAQEQAIVAAAREWATAWGKVWEGDESALEPTREQLDEVNDKSKTLHDAVLDLEREIVARRRRSTMPGYDEALERWLS